MSQPSNDPKKKFKEVEELRVPIAYQIIFMDNLLQQTEDPGQDFANEIQFPRIKIDKVA